MDKNEVIKLFKEHIRHFTVTKVIDTGELYVATVCSHSGEFVPAPPYSMSYDGEFGRYNIMDPEKYEKLCNGTVLYKDFGPIEAREYLQKNGYDV